MGKVKNHHFYVCSHTHWDREWYGSFEDFRMRLVELTDELLDYLEDEPEYRCFNFDGQTVVVRDYLEIRPARLDDFRKAVAAGRIRVGPWYILPDEFLVSGESLVRNLRLGHRIAGELGRVAKVGYLPDCFGQASQIPQILLGFGIDTYIFWRGFSPEHDLPELWVEGPDGSRVLAYHLHDGYCNLAFMPHQAPPEVRRMGSDESDVSDRPDKSDGKSAIRWSVRAKFLTLKALAERQVLTDGSKVHLMMNGFDHMRIHKDLPEVLRRAQEECEGWTFHHASFEEFFEALKAERGDWPVARTPMRDTARDPASGAYILDGVLSSRIYLKQANARCQTLLERWAAPFETLKWLEGGRYEQAFLDRAWELLLQNQPHDSICGCSVDAVHRDNENRFARCGQIGEQLLRRAQTALASRMDCTFAKPDEGVLIVFNPSLQPSSQLVEAQLQMDAKGFLPMAGAADAARKIRGVQLFDHEGREIAASVSNIRTETTNEPHAPDELGQVNHHRLIADAKFWADDLPPLGYRAYRFRFVNRPTHRSGPLFYDDDTMANEFLKVTVGGDGTIGIAEQGRTKEDAERLPRWIDVHYEDGGDCGDSYNYAKPMHDRIVVGLGCPTHVEIVEDFPGAAAFEITQRLDVPEFFDAAAQRRSEKRVPIEIVTRVTLGAQARYVVFRTRLKNTARDHRFRVRFNPWFELGSQTQLAAFAEGPFDVVQWPIAPRHPDPEHWIENQPATLPQHSFVDVSDGTWGIAIFNKGLPEVEVVREPEPRIYLTLFRSFGHLSRVDNPARKGSAGPELATPEGQCLREMEFEFAVFPHAGRWDEAGVQMLAHEFAVGTSSLCVAPHAGDLPPAKEFLRLEGDPNIALSTIERSQDGEGVIIRLWNGTEQSREGRLVFDRPVKSAHRVRLDETIEEALKVMRQQEVPLKIGAKKIMTVKAVIEKRT
ncbi:MAG: glycosyl hydrolase-related protein [Candidatus Sumerlaeia bacterium]|nr:glycosyl hydrolase-related protein [Candidatus Sumerlaeia bacterium]